MPHVELKYSNDLDLDTTKLFDVVEKIINEHDASAGVCKSRAYPSTQYKYPHLFIIVSLLTKPHRDKDFTNRLSAEIETAVKEELKQSLYFSLSVEYNSDYYTTNVHLIDGDELLGM